MNIIASKNNEFFKKLKKLTKKKYRDREKLFFAEGVKFLEFQEKPKFIVVKEGIYKNYKHLIDKHNCEKIELSYNLFDELSSQENSQGVIVYYTLKVENIKNLSNNIVILDGISDPGNLGTIIRTIDAVGLKDIILTNGSVDCYNPKCVRSTMGSIINIRINYMNEKEIIKLLKENNYKIISTALKKDSISYLNLNISEKNAFVFGNEGKGVSEYVLQHSDEKIIIPLYGMAESLNVGVATGVVLYEIKKQF